MKGLILVIICGLFINCTSSGSHYAYNNASNQHQAYVKAQRKKIQRQMRRFDDCSKIGNKSFYALPAKIK